LRNFRVQRSKDYLRRIVSEIIDLVHTILEHFKTTLPLVWLQPLVGPCIRHIDCAYGVDIQSHHSVV